MRVEREEVSTIHFGIENLKTQEMLATHFEMRSLEMREVNDNNPHQVHCLGGWVQKYDLELHS